MFVYVEEELLLIYPFNENLTAHVLTYIITKPPESAIHESHIT